MVRLSKKQRKKLKTHLNAQKEKNPVDTLKAEIRREMTPVIQEHIGKAVANHIAASIITLRDDFGFGKKRLVKYFEGCLNQMEAIKEGYVTADDILRMIEEETGFELADLLTLK